MRSDALIEDIKGALGREPGLFGGLFVREDWPAAPYLTVRVTRDRARWADELARMYRHNQKLDVLEVEFSVDDLEAVHRRVDADHEVLDDEDLLVVDSGVDLAANRVALEVVSARRDAVRRCTRATATRSLSRRTTRGY